jgi:uncharacterized protein (TIGR03437 family)
MNARETAQVEIVRGGRRTGPATVSIAARQPGIFTAQGGTGGQAIVLNQDGSFNSPSNPAAKGSTVSIFATGAGQTDPPGVNGAWATDDRARPLSPVIALIGGIGADLISARVPRGAFAGLIQVDARVPANAPASAETPLALTVGDVISPPATIAIR